MGQKERSQFSDVLVPTGTSSRMITPDQIFREINNMYPTEEGGYRSIRKGATLMYNKSASFFPKLHGIHHATLDQGQRDILLLHAGNEVWEMPWEEGIGFNSWRVLLGPSSSSPLLNWNVTNDDAKRFPTQFITLPNGVLILAEGHKPYFYDGEVVAEFGFEGPPSTPTIRGPEDTTGKWTPLANSSGVNDQGYTHHRLADPSSTNARPGAADSAFGFGRIGTIYESETIDASVFTPADLADPDQAAVGGYVLTGRWRGRVAYIDKWGNISELSPESEDVTITKELATAYTGTKFIFLPAKYAQRWLYWDSISQGPKHCIGRILYRTKDLENSGSAAYWFLPSDAQLTQSVFATLKDREGSSYSDNIPDSWLNTVAPEYDSMRPFLHGAVQFGRLWMTGIQDEPGVVRASAIGRFGTVERNIRIYPDPSGAEVVAIAAVPQGLMAWTELGTYLITLNDSGESFRSSIISTTVGCSAPRSVVVNRQGHVIWLARDGFYRWTGEGRPEFLFQAHRDESLRMNRARLGLSSAILDPTTGEYQCWVAHEGSRYPNRRYKFTEEGYWHWDDFDGTVQITGLCVSQDHRQVQFACGLFGANYDVYVLGRDWNNSGTVQEAKLVTGWLNSATSNITVDSRRVKLWLRETGVDTADNTRVSVKVRRNYRGEVLETHYVDRYPNIDTDYTSVEPNPSKYGDTVGDGVKWRRRRPYYVTIDPDIQNVETFQLEISSTSDIEVIGLQYEYNPNFMRGETR